MFGVLFSDTLVEYQCAQHKLRIREKQDILDRSRLENKYR